MKWFRKVVDERQEQEMMRVEHSTFWIVFFGLVIAILTEVFVLGWGLQEIAGELTVLLVGCVWMLIGDMRCGSWDYFSKPGLKSYLCYSTIAGIIPATGIALSMYLRYEIPAKGCIAAFFICFFITWGCTFFLLWLTGEAVKRRSKRLQQALEEDDSAQS